MKIKWKKLFDWTVVSVSDPIPDYYDYNHAGRGRTFLGYRVNIVYKHHGSMRAFFGVDPEKFAMVTPTRAYNRAKAYCNRMRAKIKNENNK